MTMTPLTTIADALIDFILSLLRDPAAAQEYQADPEGTLDRAGLGGCSVADVRSVAPVIYDHPAVVPSPPQTVYVPTPSGPSHPTNPVQQAISNIVNNFHVDSRSMVLDQSVNQNIWADGDVNQVFDQSAVVNTGDHGVAAGNNAGVDNSSTDIGGDLNVGNTTTDTTIDDSYNDNSDNSDNSVDTTATDSFNDGSTTAPTDTTIDDSFNDSSDNSADDSYNDNSDNSDNSVALDDTSVDASSSTVETSPDDPFVDDQS